MVCRSLPWIGASIWPIWSVWPSEKSLIDPIAVNVTGKGYRNFGDSLAAISNDKKRGYLEEKKQSNIEDNDFE